MDEPRDREIVDLTVFIDLWWRLNSAINLFFQRHGMIKKACYNRYSVKEIGQAGSQNK